VYLFLVELREPVQPNAKIPLVLLPVADDASDAVDAAATPDAVEVHEEYVYLFLVVDVVAHGF
jgi:hypothetical protein